MKTVLVIVAAAAILVGMALAAPLMAQSTDYSKMSTDQLYQMKQDPDHANDMDLQSEWMKRMVNMSPDELKKYRIPYTHEQVQKMYENRAGGGIQGRTN